MWRDKISDIDLITTVIDDLLTFKNLKDIRWERVDEEIQKANPLATPMEDWITPPDEGKALIELEKDPKYVKLRRRLIENLPKLKIIAEYLRFNTHHDFDWVNFTTPLIGNEALEDGLGMAKKLLKACENTNYAWVNVLSFINFR